MAKENILLKNLSIKIKYHEKIVLYSVILLCVAVKIQAQSPIIPKYTPQAKYKITNAYYKNVNNFQNQYEGTWLYTNGSTSLKITLVKKPMFYNADPLDKYYEDLLIGEYQYIENGVEKVNTLANLNTNHSDYLDYNLYSAGRVKKYVTAVCYECAENEFRIQLYLNEPSRRNLGGLSNDFIIRRFTESGIEKIKIWFVKTGLTKAYNDYGDTDIENYSLPYGTYVLTKQ